VRGTSVLIAPPTVGALSLADCKSALGITATKQDTIMSAAIDAAAAAMDPASGGWLARALRPQTWEFRLSEFPVGDYGFEPGYANIILPYPVHTAVSSVKYDDGDGVERTLNEGTDYRVFGLGGHNRAYISPVINKTWPYARPDMESVRIRYVSGYASAVAADPEHLPPILAVADKMPAPIKQAIVLSVRMLLSNIERNLFISMDRVEGVGEKRYIISDVANKMIEQATTNLLANFRVYG
jgi:uncharacterized phiE125 gp8 family phage protein